MTPLRKFRGSAGSDEFLHDDPSSPEDQTVVMEEESTATSSTPPSPSAPGSPTLSRSRRPSRTSTSSSSKGSLSSSSSNISGGGGGAPRLRHSSSRSGSGSGQHATHRHHQRGTPESRRLFDEPSFLEEVLDRDLDVSDLKLSPPRALRPTLRPVHLNHHELLGGGGALDGTLSGAPTPFPTSRKRSAAEVRGGEGAAEGFPFDMRAAADHGGAATGSAHSMSLSPHLSPNSFLTMDGRFVQSKNPFSSPMMTEDHDGSSMYTTTGVAAAKAPPSMPVAFNASGPPMNSHLPPRHNHRTSLFPASGVETFQKKYFFTGSPIQEDETMEEMSTTNYESSLGGSSHLSSSAHASTGGSLNKVRRFQLSDDIVAASGQEISTYKRALCVDTTAAKPFDAVSSHDPSPTDLQSFPMPPTPVKARPRSKESGHFYNAIRLQEPSTPSFHRQSSYDAVDSKTPHPGRARNLAPRNGPGLAEAPSAPAPVSRFTNDFDVIGELGKGSFGCVYKVLSRLDGCMYAIKAAKRQAKGVSDRDRMLKEVYALAALSDQADTATFHIVRYHQAWMEDDRLFIQTELCSGTLSGELATGPMEEFRRFKVLREILLALDFIHRQRMVHLDIKPENIFLKNDQYKLGDFGLVTRASSDQDVEEGDSRYMSMELLAGDRSDLTKSDVYSLGATLYEICLYRPLPMNGPEWQDLRSGRLVHPMPNTSLELSHIITQMMSPMASIRPTAGQLLLHPQLLSNEQKALNAEKNRVLALQLAQAQQRFPPPTLPPRRGLMRSNTWNGSSINSYL